ncbi:PREDICTED: patatin-like phospholipase domain-containing protein 5 [Condylura cristata]|uniref:patatin-like phospholipase domain-containing protein 5 n=1 Tax=Condylura cristata TaxID=143302 RepID=UPI000643CD45|nr:PREDICTED: patatin-like phospholipase domain-containing protein 5 [Condylura cristata]
MAQDRWPGTPWVPVGTVSRLGLTRTWWVYLTQVEAPARTARRRTAGQPDSVTATRPPRTCQPPVLRSPNVIVTDFATREELIQALVCTLFFPFYCGMIPPEFRGQREPGRELLVTYRALATPGFEPWARSQALGSDQPPERGREQTRLGRAGSVLVVHRAASTFLGLDVGGTEPGDPRGADRPRPPPPDPGLTKEPVLRMLVPEQCPAPAPALDAGGDGGQQARPSLDWTVPSVLIRDVPNFEQLSPKLEAALRKSCTRDPSPWARFCRSGPGRALTYLLLPCTLPLQYVYFRGRRLVLWLPDAPSDLWWVQSSLRRSALWLYSRTKAQVCGAGQLARPCQPGAARPGDLAKELRPAPRGGPRCGLHPAVARSLAGTSSSRRMRIRWQRIRWQPGVGASWRSFP